HPSAEYQSPDARSRSTTPQDLFPPSDVAPRHSRPRTPAPQPPRPPRSTAAESHQLSSASFPLAPAPASLSAISRFLHIASHNSRTIAPFHLVVLKRFPKSLHKSRFASRLLTCYV